MATTRHQQLQKGIKTLSQNDPRLEHLVQTYPAPTLQPHTDYFSELVSSIISQQLSVKAAHTIFQRFVDSFGHVPSAEEILQRDDEQLRSVGLSYQKIRYIKDMSRRTIDGSLNFTDIDLLSNEEIVTNLTAVKGIGEWTAHMFLIFCMGRLDVLPTGDLGIRTAVSRLYDITNVTPQEVVNIAEKNHWKPYESIASWYLWRSLENKPMD